MADDHHQTSRPGATPPNVPPHHVATPPLRSSSTPIVAIVALVALALLALFLFRGGNEAPPQSTSTAPAPSSAPAAPSAPAASGASSTPAAPTANGDANPPATAPVVPDAPGQDQPGQPTPNSAHTQSGAGDTSPSTSPVEAPRN